MNTPLTTLSEIVGQYEKNLASFGWTNEDMEHDAEHLLFLHFVPDIKDMVAQWCRKLIRDMKLKVEELPTVSVNPHPDNISEPIGVIFPTRTHDFNIDSARETVAFLMHIFNLKPEEEIK